MVALNTAYAAPKNAADPKNRVGDFFYEDHASVGKNRWASRLNAQEKSSYHYETASGRSNWPNRDPLGENGVIDDLEGGLVALQIANLYGFGPNDPINGFDIGGEGWFRLIPWRKLLPKPKPKLPAPKPKQKPKPKKPNGGKKGDCTSTQHATLQAAVTAACKTGSRACKGNQDCSTLSANLAKNQACASARDAINNTCFKGGDAGHKTAANEARNAAKKCQNFLSKRSSNGKCCTK